jgi:hypothetical protein
MLYMAKEQSNTFDALIACHSLVMIRHLLLACQRLHENGLKPPV